MTSEHGKGTLWAGATVAFFILSTIGCAAQKPLWGDPDTGLLLTYRAVQGDPRRYQNTVTAVQDLRTIGQRIETATDMEFSVASKARDERNLILGITIDKLHMGIGGSSGEFSPDTSDLAGKGFDMTLSPEGREMDVAGAARLTYETSPFTKGNLKILFHRIFPDLPPHSVRVGDTWTTVNVATSDDGDAQTDTSVEYLYTLEGLETVNGRQCIRVTGRMTGTIEGKGIQMGSAYTMSGKLEGTSKWYFAYKEGVLVHHSVDFTGDVNIENAMGTLPMALVNSEELKLAL